MFRYFNHLGFNNPYYVIKDNHFLIKRKISEILSEYGDSRIIDATSVVELLNKNYMFGDRTLIQGIYRTPWLARPDLESTAWKFTQPSQHGNIDIPEEKIAHNLFLKLCNELVEYIGTNKRIGVLLSGGMDSRMVAGAIDFVIKTDRLQSVEVTGLTWGNDGTRDVVYAKEISNRLNWQWKHYTVTAKDMLRNIAETAIHGCEYSPIHLHAIPQMRDDNELDVILAGSYGDSVGRAEYSGRKVTHIKPLLNNISNVGCLIKPNLYEHIIDEIKKDINRYHELFPRELLYMQNELDYQLHYMRRMLNPCMELFTERSEFFNAFTHPDVYEYIWSIRPEKRNNSVYKYMLNEFKTNLSDIPWARTGLPFGQTKGKPDEFLKEHHSYVNIIRDELWGKIKSLILSEEIRNLEIFNLKAIKFMIYLTEKFPFNSLYYLEKLIWIASLSEMIKLYHVDGQIQNKISNDRTNRYSLLKEYLFVYIKHILRKMLIN